MRYREATPDDLPAICVLGEEVNAIHHAAFPQVFAGPGSVERDREVWSQSIGQPAATTFVAEDETGVVGFVNLALLTETNPLVQPMRFGRIGSVSVTASRRGQGIGKALMSRAEAWVAARGGNEVRLNVWAFNVRAVELYRELGYELRLHGMAKPCGDGGAPTTGTPA